MPRARGSGEDAPTALHVPGAGTAVQSWPGPSSSGKEDEDEAEDESEMFWGTGPGWFSTGGAPGMQKVQGLGGWDPCPSPHHPDLPKVKRGELVAESMAPPCLSKIMEPRSRDPGCESWSLTLIPASTDCPWTFA